MTPHAPGAKRPDVSIVVVTWNSARWISRCLESIPAALGSLAGEIVVIDNASVDDTLEEVKRVGVASTLIANANNRGFAGAINQGVAGSTARFVLFLNPDCRPEPASIQRLADRLSSDEHLAAVVPVLVGLDGSPQTDFQFRRLPTLASVVAELMLVHRLWPGNPATRSYRCADLDVTKRVAVEQPAAAAILLRRSTLEWVGGMDESFHPAWFEDVDLCARIAKIGQVIEIEPTARVIHEGGSSLESMSHASFARVWYRNLYRYVRKWFTPFRAEIVRWIIIKGMTLRIFATIVVGSPSGRREMIRTYSSVIEDAIHRWPDKQLSS